MPSRRRLWKLFFNRTPTADILRAPSPSLPLSPSSLSGRPALVRGRGRSTTPPLPSPKGRDATRRAADGGDGKARRSMPPTTFDGGRGGGASLGMARCVGRQQGQTGEGKMAGSHGSVSAGAAVAGRRPPKMGGGGGADDHIDDDDDDDGLVRAESAYTGGGRWPAGLSRGVGAASEVSCRGWTTPRRDHSGSRLRG